MWVRTLAGDLRRSGAFATSVAVTLCAVALIGVVAAVTRGTGSDATAQNHAAVSTVTRGWVRVVDRKVGFAARLPGQPQDVSFVSHGGGLRVPVKAARVSHRIAIERIRIPDLSSTYLARIFRAAIDSLASGTGFQVESEGATTFRGQLAREVRYVTDNGTSYEAVIFVDGAGDLYLIASPARYFDAVTTSFQVLVPQSRSLGY